jgi:hypothetical protein
VYTPSYHHWSLATHSDGLLRWVYSDASSLKTWRFGSRDYLSEYPDITLVMVHEW